MRSRPSFRLAALATGAGLALVLGAMPAAAQATPGATADAAPTAAQARLAGNLIRQMERDAGRGGNILVSPASLAAAFAAIAVGADDKLRPAIHKALGYSAGKGTVANADLDRLREAAAAVQKRGADGPLKMATTIVFDPQAKPHAHIPETLAKSGITASVEDLSDPAAIERLNAWVAERTAGLIPKILEATPREPGLIALNALHFKDRWRTPFSREATRPAPFRRVTGGEVEVPMMRHLAGRFRFRADARFIAVDLPYASAGFSLTVVTSRDKPLPASGFDKAADWLTGQAFREAPGEVALPRFSLSGGGELLEALDALGLKSARLSPKALSGLSAASQIITQVTQRAVIAVDEEGTEAAAATAIGTTRSMPEGFQKIIVDKPFLFALRDAASGLILIAGYVGNPLAKARTAASDTPPPRP